MVNKTTRCPRYIRQGIFRNWDYYYDCTSNALCQFAFEFQFQFGRTNKSASHIKTLTSVPLSARQRRKRKPKSSCGGSPKFQIQWQRQSKKLSQPYFGFSFMLLLCFSNFSRSSDLREYVFRIQVRFSLKTRIHRTPSLSNSFQQKCK